MDPKELAPHLDFANHHPHATQTDIKYVCVKVLEHDFNAAFMNPYWVPICRQQLDFPGKIGTIVSFPLGQESLDIKIESAKQYASFGANELDIVLNISFIKEAKWDQVFAEMHTIVDSVKADHPQVIIKFIPECGYLNPDEIKHTAELMVKANVDFFKTCSGMGPRGAIVDDVKYVKEAVGDQIKIKCAGGIDTLEEAQALLNAGAIRLGTSHALDIIGATPNTDSVSTSALNE
jgi:deoxyribose-phosphate aldolase